MVIHQDDIVTVFLTFRATFEGYRAETFKSAKDLKKLINQFAALYKFVSDEDNPSGVYREDLLPIGDYEYNFSFTITRSVPFGNYTFLLIPALAFANIQKMNFSKLDLIYGIKIL